MTAVKILNVTLAATGLIALLFLVWGAFKYILSIGDEELSKAARGLIIKSLIGLAVIMLLFILIRLSANLLSDEPVSL